MSKKINNNNLKIYGTLRRFLKPIVFYGGFETQGILWGF